MKEVTPYRYHAVSAPLPLNKIRAHPMHNINQAISTLQAGRPIIMVDDEDRENEGDLIFPAQNTNAQAIAFMLKYCSGIICLSLPGEHLDRLHIPLMVPKESNTSRLGTNFTVSIEAKNDITTGVSAQDRAQTIATAIKENCQPDDIAMPGHIFPLRAHPQGLKARQGHTEASIAIVELAGFQSAAVLCELMNPDGTMARMPEITTFAQQHSLSVVSTADLLEYINTN
jgi:3,4-dihydroxy 2-butanone 4-phosphate synthase